MRFHRGAGDYTDMVRGLAFSPGGTKLASPSLDGTTGVYTLNLDEWVARSRLAHCFTLAGCQQCLQLDQCPPSL